MNDLIITQAYFEPLFSSDDFLVGDDEESLYGTEDHDILSGAVFIFGGSGHDAIDNREFTESSFFAFGGKGNDILLGSKTSNNLMFGEEGIDQLLGGDKADLLVGGSGYGDWLYGGKGSDILVGGSGEDQLIGAEDADNLFGGGGRDSFIFYPVLSGDLDLIHDYTDGIDKVGVTSRVEALGWYYDVNLGQTVVVDTETNLFFTKIQGNVASELDPTDFYQV